jgi:hypothetical protein
MRERSSLEAAFAAYWPPAKPKRKSVALSPVSEPEDKLGLGQPNDWTDWFHDGEKYGVLVRVSMGDGTSIQFKNTSAEVKKAEARFGNQTFRLTINPGQHRDIQAKGDGSWWWTVL